MKISSLSNFEPIVSLDLQGIEENYLNSVYLDFYFPQKFDPTMIFKSVSDNGRTYLDAVSGLYSEEGVKSFNSMD